MVGRQSHRSGGMEMERNDNAVQNPLFADEAVYQYGRLHALGIMHSATALVQRPRLADAIHSQKPRTVVMTVLFALLCLERPAHSDMKRAMRLAVRIA